VLGIDPVLIGNASYVGLYLAPFFFVEFYKNIFSISKLPKILKIARTTAILFPPVAFGTAFFMPAGLLSVLPGFYVVAVPVFVLVLFHSIRNKENAVYRRTFLAGFAFLLLAGLWEAANEIRLINSSFRSMPLGMLAFYLSLATIQGQFFANLFRTAKLNAQNELIARQRLQRVLECTHTLSKSKEYRSLFHVVANNVSQELNIENEPHSIDFILSRASAEEGNDSDERITHFTYEVTVPGEPGMLAEVLSSADDSGSQHNSENSTKITSLPGVYSSGYSNFNLNPASTLTVQVDFGIFHGAVVARRYSNAKFSTFEREQYLKFVESISASLMISIQNIDYLSEVKKKALIDLQMDAAKAQQVALLPQPPKIPNISYSSYSRSAGKTGGDWHGCFFEESSGRLFIAVGDVTGHDFAASILTGVAAGAVKAWQATNHAEQVTTAEAIESLAELLNLVICTSSQGLKYMTMIFVCIEVDTGLCYIVNAGHTHPYFVSKGQKPICVPFSGHILGQSMDYKYKSERVQLSEDDTIIFYTDGLFDNEGSDGTKLQRRKFIQFWHDNFGKEESLEKFVGLVSEIWGESELEDDVTILYLAWKQSESEKIPSPEVPDTVSRAG
jgi:serine phosphatase RsbU (regulator of sigma subunit)